MKRLLTSVSLCSTAILSSLITFSSPATALTEQEPNDIRPNIGTITTGSIAIQGRMPSSRDVDLYRLEVAPGIASFTFGKFSSMVSTTAIRWELYRDRNRNDRIDASDMLITRNTQARPATLDVKATSGERYLLRLRKVGVASPRLRYRFFANGRKVVPARVGLKVISAQAHDRFDKKIPFSKRHRADFRVKASMSGQMIAGNPLSSKRLIDFKTRTIKDNDHPKFNRRSTTLSPKTTTHFRGSLILDDMDFTGLSQSAAITPGGHSQFFYTFRADKNQVFDGQGRLIGQANRPITIKGSRRLGLKRASLTFVVIYQKTR